MLTKRMAENIRKQGLYFDAYSSALIDVENSIIFRMYSKNEPIEKISKYLDMNKDIVQEIIDNLKNGRRK